jgi:hypothetical protein
MSALINQARNRVPKFAEAAVERARLTVVPRVARSRAPRVPFVTLVSLVLVAGVAGLLFFNTSMQQASFAATALENRARVLDAHEQSLQMELAELRDPQRVALAAQEQGMVAPDRPAFIRLSDGKVLGNPTAATTADDMRVTPLPPKKPRSLRPRPIVIEVRPAEIGTAVSSDGASSTAERAAAGTKKTTDRNREQGSAR